MRLDIWQDVGGACFGGPAVEYLFGHLVVVLWIRRSAVRVASIHGDYDWGGFGWSWVGFAWLLVLRLIDGNVETVRLLVLRYLKDRGDMLRLWSACSGGLCSTRPAGGMRWVCVPKKKRSEGPILPLNGMARIYAAVSSLIFSAPARCVRSDCSVKLVKYASGAHI